MSLQVVISRRFRTFVEADRALSEATPKSAPCPCCPIHLAVEAACELGWYCDKENVLTIFPNDPTVPDDIHVLEEILGIPSEDLNVSSEDLDVPYDDVYQPSLHIPRLSDTGEAFVMQLLEACPTTVEYRSLSAAVRRRQKAALIALPYSSDPIVAASLSWGTIAIFSSAELFFCSMIICEWKRLLHYWEGATLTDQVLETPDLQLEALLDHPRVKEMVMWFDECVTLPTNYAEQTSMIIQERERYQENRSHPVQLAAQWRKEREALAAVQEQAAVHVQAKAVVQEQAKAVVRLLDEATTRSRNPSLPLEALCEAGTDCVDPTCPALYHVPLVKCIHSILHGHNSRKHNPKKCAYVHEGEAGIVIDDDPLPIPASDPRLSAEDYAKRVFKAEKHICVTHLEASFFAGKTKPNGEVILTKGGLPMFCGGSGGQW